MHTITASADEKSSGSSQLIHVHVENGIELSCVSEGTDGLLTELRAECKSLVVVALRQRTTGHSGKVMLIAC